MKRRSLRVKRLDQTIAVLRKEMHDPYTKSLGKAAVKSVSETLTVVRAERNRLVRKEKRKR